MNPSSQNDNQQPASTYHNDLAEVQTVPTNRGTFSKPVWVIVGALLFLGLAATIIIPIAVTVVNTKTTAATTMITSVTTGIITTTIVTTATTTTATPSMCGTTYSQSFTNGSATSSQCTAWWTFTSGLNCSSYSSLRIYGSNDPVGLNITNSTVVTGIATALSTNGTYNIFLNGYNWLVGPCSTGYEISTTGNLCTCNTGYTIRPCMSNASWGGINGSTCDGGTQTMSLYME